MASGFRRDAAFTDGNGRRRSETAKTLSATTLPILLKARMHTNHLWQSSRRAFLHVAQAQPETLAAAWHRKTGRTQCYGDLLETVAERLGLALEREFLAIDFILMSGESRVPWIAIESENDSWDVAHEIAKLSAVASPVRVLLTVAEWDQSLGGWSHAGQKSELLPKWGFDFRGRLEAWQHPGTIGLLVGERGRDERLRYYSYTFDE
jgi:hypothetical protein